MKERDYDVIGFGALNLDKLYRVSRIAKAGEHVPILGVTESPGGSAANTVAGLARLGASCGFIGAVGCDAEGRTMLDDFKKFNVDTSGICVLEEGRTGIIIGFVDSEGERTLYPYPGANSMFEEKDMDYSYARKAKFIHITSFVDSKQMLLQKKLVNELSEVRISFSPGDLYVKKGMNALMPFIKKSSVIFLNSSEASELTGKKYKEACLTLIDKGAQIVAVTLGGKGSYVTDGVNSFKVSAYKTNVRDTTGAGDAFAAGFLHRILEGSSIDEAARSGNIAASFCIRESGARCGLACREDLQNF
jgi:ribokinase